MTITRREFLKWVSATAGASAIAGCATTGAGGGAGRVVVIGAGYGGATAAKYIRMWAPDIEVTVVERGTEFVSCPMSNLVLGGNATIQDVTMGYGGLRDRGVQLVRGEVAAIDAAKHEVRLADGSTLGYDRVIVSPGIDFMYDQIPGLNERRRARSHPARLESRPADHGAQETARSDA